MATVCVSVVRAIATEVLRRGYDASAMLAEAGIAEALLDDARARVDDVTLDVITRWALAHTGDPAFGLGLGEHASIASFGVVGHMASQCRTLSEVFEGLLGYYRIVADVAAPRLETIDGRLHLICDIVRTGDAACNLMRAEFLMARLAMMGRQFVGDSADEIELWFTHASPAHVAEYTRVFGGRARFGMPHLAFVMSHALLGLTQRHHDSGVLGAMRSEADKILLGLDDTNGVSQRMRQLMLAADPLEKPEMADVARKLGMSERSLRRRLADADLSFHDVVHEARGVLATRLLEAPGASVRDVASRLGFETTTAFHRAFKRWTGKTPSQVLARASR